MARVTAFLDTNVFLHCQPVTQIPWLDVLDCDTVELAVAQVVLEELDEQKDLGRTPRIKDRARDATHLAERAVRGTQPAGLPANVTIRFVEEPSGFNYEAEHLSHEVPDDRLVATMLDFKENNPECELWLVSGDSTPRVKAFTRGLEATVLAEKYHLDTESAVEKELRQLRQQKEELDASTPSLTLVVLNGAEDTFLKADIKSVESVPEEEIQEQMQQLSKKFHELAGGRLEPGTSSTSPGLVVPIPKDERERFKREFDEWLDDYREYLQSLHAYEQLGRRTEKVVLGIHNSGKIPAENIDIDLHVEADIEVWTEDEILPEPEEPKPPRKPQTIHEMIQRTVNRPLFDPASMLTSVPNSMPLQDPSVSGWDVRESESVELSSWMDQVKQDRTRELPPWWLVFPPDWTPKSFAVEYVLRADNVPGTIRGDFGVVVSEG